MRIGRILVFTAHREELILTTFYLISNDLRTLFADTNGRGHLPQQKANLGVFDATSELKKKVLH